VATRGALLIAATSQNPRSLRCDRSIKILNRLQAPISSLPRSVRPGPVSGEDGQRNGTPCPKAFDRLQTGPRERSPAAYNTSRSSKLGSIASAPSICRTGANTPSSIPCWISSTLRQTRTRPCDSLSIRRRRDTMAKTALCAGINSTVGGNGALLPTFGEGAASLGPTARLPEGTKIANNPPANPP
jgi:hypothetical protein